MDFRMLLLRHCKNGYLISGIIGIITPIAFVFIKHFFFGHPVQFSYQEGPIRTVTLIDKLIIIAIAGIILAISKIKVLHLQAHRYLFIMFALIYSFVMLSDDIMNHDVNFSSGYQTLLLLIAVSCIPFRPAQFFMLGFIIFLFFFPGLYYLPQIYGIHDLTIAPNQAIHLALTVIILTGVSAFLYKSRCTTYMLNRKSQDLEDELFLHDQDHEQPTKVANMEPPSSDLQSRLHDQRLTVSDINIKSTEDVFLDNVKNVIEEHLGDSNFGVEWLAYEVSISPRQLQRKLKAHANITAGALIRLMRIQRAEQLLHNKAGNISEIAYQTGFNDPVYFSKLFKKFYGVTPSDYERETESD